MIFNKMSEDLPFSLDLRNHITVIIITQGTREFLVVHGRFVFPLTPQTCTKLWIVQFEFAGVTTPFNY